MPQSTDLLLYWLAANVQLLVPFALVVWMGLGDLFTRRIPNYLTLGAALAGLGSGKYLSVNATTANTPKLIATINK